jgi:hypothetical protein
MAKIGELMLGIDKIYILPAYLTEKYLEVGTQPTGKF